MRVRKHGIQGLCCIPMKRPPPRVPMLVLDNSRRSKHHSAVYATTRPDRIALNCRRRIWNLSADILLTPASLSLPRRPGNYYKVRPRPNGNHPEDKKGVRAVYKIMREVGLGAGTKPLPRTLASSHDRQAAGKQRAGRGAGKRRNRRKAVIGRKL